MRSRILSCEHALTVDSKYRPVAIRASFRGGFLPPLETVNFVLMSQAVTQCVMACDTTHQPNKELRLNTNTIMNHKTYSKHNHILLLFLFHMSTISSKSLSFSSGGDSIAILIKLERLVSLRLLRSRVLISFICEKLRSIDAVATGIDKK